METKNTEKRRAIIYLVKFENCEEVIATSQPIKKYLSDIKTKNKKVSETLKTIINNNYLFFKLEEFEYSTKNELNERINHFKFLQQNQFNKIETKLINELYDKGCHNEDLTIPKLNKFFNCEFIKLDRYNKYDLASIDTGYFVEIKTNNYSIDKYPNAVIGFNKIQNYDKLIFVFNYLTFDWQIVNGKPQFVEDIETYYIFYDKQLFDTFNKRFITNQLTGKTCFVIDIPACYLKLVDLENSLLLNIS